MCSQVHDIYQTNPVFLIRIWLGILCFNTVNQWEIMTQSSCRKDMKKWIQKNCQGNHIQSNLCIHEYDHCWLNWLSQFDFYSIWKADCFTQKIIFQQGLSISAYRSSTDLDMDQGRNWKTLQQKLQVLCFLSAVFHWAVQQIWGGILIRKLLMRPLSITRQAVV